MEYMYTGMSNDAILIAHLDMQSAVYTRVNDGKVLILEENMDNGHQWMVYYLPTCQFGFIDKNQVVFDE